VFFRLLNLVQFSSAPIKTSCTVFCARIVVLINSRQNLHAQNVGLLLKRQLLIHYCIYWINIGLCSFFCPSVCFYLSPATLYCVNWNKYNIIKILNQLWPTGILVGLVFACRPDTLTRVFQEHCYCGVTVWCKWQAYYIYYLSYVVTNFETVIFEQY